MNPVRFRGILLAAALVLFGQGCGAKDSDQPETAPVTGVVQMDGKPLPNALIVFSPAEGRSSTGVTNDEGKYRLRYLNNVQGARIGKHTVSITTNIPDEADPKYANFKETIPAIYNSKTTLEADVVNGTNQFDFDLQSKPAKK